MDAPELKTLITQLRAAHAMWQKHLLQADTHSRHVDTGKYDDLEENEKKLHSSFQEKASIAAEKVKLLVERIVEKLPADLVADYIKNDSLIMLNAHTRRGYLALKPVSNPVSKPQFELLIVDSNHQPC